MYHSNPPTQRHTRHTASVPAHSSATSNTHHPVGTHHSHVGHTRSPATGRGNRQAHSQFKLSPHSLQNKQSMHSVHPRGPNRRRAPPTDPLQQQLQQYEQHTVAPLAVRMPSIDPPHTLCLFACLDYTFTNTPGARLSAPAAQPCPSAAAQCHNAHQYPCQLLHQPCSLVQTECRAGEAADKVAGTRQTDGKRGPRLLQMLAQAHSESPDFVPISPFKGQCCASNPTRGSTSRPTELITSR